MAYVLFVCCCVLLISLVLFVSISCKKTLQSLSSSSHTCPCASSSSPPLLPSAPSTSSSTPESKYDVFLSFRGEDSRSNFVSHLYKQLKQNGINTFKDDQELERDRSVNSSLLAAIQRSKFSFVILSENYATSSWCLDELVHIVECMRNFGQIIVPIFYEIDPSHVKNLTWSFAQAFKKHQANVEMAKILRWKDALKTVGSIAGWDSRFREEARLIDDIVGWIWDRLGFEFSREGDKLGGMAKHIEQMDSMLSTPNAQMVGIWGMGGVGKSTIARTVYARFAPHYEGSCFVENVKHNFMKHGAAFLREKLLCEILSKADSLLHTGLLATKTRLIHKRVFVVLDDVDDLEQLETLAGELDWFGPGSKIIVTTRDKHLLVTHGVKYIYEVKCLSGGDALQLFGQYAFKLDHPTAEYMELSNQFASYAKGLPLALKVLGYFLYKKNAVAWRKELEKLQNFPEAKVQDVLKISYDGLNDDKQKDTFLDIACFYNGEDGEFVAKLLDYCGFYPDIDLEVLVDRALITIADSKIWIHDLIQQMGREIVRQQSVRDPGKRSRLWDPRDVLHVLESNTGTEAVEAIFLDTSSIDEDLFFSSDAFKGMHNLRMLSIYSPSEDNQGNTRNFSVHLPRSLNFLSGELIYLYWHRCSLRLLPCHFHPKKLREFNMPYSNLEQLWEGAEPLMKLKRIDLSHSQNLTDVGDLSKALNLESVNLEACISLSQLHSSIRGLKKLVNLNLEGCENLTKPPETAVLESLEDLSLSGCSHIKVSPEIPRNIKHLHLDLTSVEILPSSIKYSHRLVSLSLKNCQFLSRLPQGLCSLKFLKLLILSGCSKLTELPENLGNLTSLEVLEAEDIGIKTLPTSVAHLQRLEVLSLRGCKGEDSSGLVLPPLHGLCSIETLNLSDCNISELPEDLGSLPCLKFLDISRNSFECVPESILKLPRLHCLRLAECKRLRSLPIRSMRRLKSNIEKIDAHDCTSLENVSYLYPCSSKCNLSLIFTNCFKLKQSAYSKITTRSLLQICSARFYKEGPTNSLRVYFPGGQIPSHFMHRSVGSSVDFWPHRQPIDGNNNFIGLVVCAVISLSETCSDFALRYECRHIAVDGLLDSDFGLLDDCYDRKEESRLVKSDHVFIGYTRLFSGVVRSTSWTRSTIELCITGCNHNGRLQQCCQVKQCGVILVPVR